MEELKIHVAKLHALLNDPQVGLSSWCEMYAEHMRWIVNYWNNN